jgi:hypothetical protein
MVSYYLRLSDPFPSKIGVSTWVPRQEMEVNKLVEVEPENLIIPGVMRDVKDVLRMFLDSM